MGNPQKIPESLLAQIWKGQWIQKGPLPASDGRMVQVRSQGIENKDSGPDFIGATILLDDEIVTGDVELHVKSSDWRSHGHQHDPHFNSAILQVVLWDDSKSPAQLQNGNSIPTLSLHSYLNGSMDELAVRAEEQQVPSLPCRGIGNTLGDGKIGGILDQYGKERFYVKSAYFEVELILEEPAQVLYRGIMGSLGYTKNKAAFQELARRLPLRVIESIIGERQSEDRILILQALFLGAAGLLPSQYEWKCKSVNSSEISQLENVWQSLKVKTAMSYADWHFFRMHPKNFPTSRLLAAASLFDQYLDNGLLEEVMDLVRKASPGKGSTSIEKGIIIPELLGQGRAREIAVNVILPFSLAWAQTNTQQRLKQHVLELYQKYPKSGENQITRYLGKLLWDDNKAKSINSAQRQQGMIHLYKTFCQEQRCRVCPVVTNA
jgi:hypothetical protein